jgi:hypothetical protein
MCCIAMNCKKCLIMCVMIVLTMLCYVLLLSCNLGNVLVVQPFLPPTTNIYIYMYIYNVVCFAHEKTPPHFKQPSG